MSSSRFGPGGTRTESSAASLSDEVATGGVRPQAVETGAGGEGEPEFEFEDEAMVEGPNENWGRCE